MCHSLSQWVPLVPMMAFGASQSLILQANQQQMVAVPAESLQSLIGKAALHEPWTHQVGIIRDPTMLLRKLLQA